MGTERHGAPKGNTNAVTHGLYAVRRHGAERLPEALRGIEIEIAKELQTRAGTIAELRRVGLYYALIVETAVHHLRELADKGENPWTAGEEGKPIPLLKTLGTYLAGLQRTCAVLADLQPKDADVFDYEAALMEQAESD